MKNLKFLFLTLFSVISLSVFSQTQVYTTNTSGPNICDGTAALDTSNVNISSIYWQGMGAIINQGSYYVTNLCPGTYIVAFSINGSPSTSLTFVITAGTLNPCTNFGGFTTSTNSVDSTTCDGVISATVTGGQSPYTYLWSNASTTPYIGNLCPGSYCCYVTDINGCNTTICDTVGIQSPNYGDTLIINGNNCQFPQGNVISTLEYCSFNYNAVDSAYLSFVQLPTNPLDSNMALNWEFVDTLGAITSLTTVAPLVNVSGCYEFTLILYCYQKSLNIKTIIVNDADALFLSESGINELSMSHRKLIKVIDMMGKETKLEPNRLLIKCYDDGSTEKVYINQ
jgi:hypothetical protein